VPMAKARLERETRPERRALASAADETRKKEALGALAAKLRHLAECEAAGFARYDRLAPGSTALSASAAAAGKAVSDEAELMVDSAAAVAGISGPVADPESGPLGEDGSLVPKRNPDYFTCLALDGVPIEEWEKVGVGRSPRWWGPETCALWWCDGERSLDEIARRVILDVGGFKTDLVGYFRMLERHGYVGLAEGMKGRGGGLTA